MNEVDEYRPFSEIAEAVLQMIAASQSQQLQSDEMELVQKRLSSLPPYADVKAALQRLKDSGFRLATLTCRCRCKSPSISPLKTTAAGRPLRGRQSELSARLYILSPVPAADNGRQRNAGLVCLSLLPLLPTVVSTLALPTTTDRL